MNIPYTILGTGSYLPELVVDNRKFAQIMDTSDEWITSRTGISQRHLSAGEATWSMGVKAGKKALEMAQIDPDQIDGIIATTITPDYTTPNLASIIQADLQAKNAFCFDVNAACTGFVHAFDIAMRYLAGEQKMTFLIVSSESLSKLVDFEDRRTAVLFGDGAGAVILSNRKADGSPIEKPSIYEAFLAADGTGGEYMTGIAFDPVKHPFVEDNTDFPKERFSHDTGAYLSMKGQDVYRFATTAMPIAIEKVAQQAQMSLDQIDFVVPHQANDRILQAAAKRLGLPTEKMISYISETGNTSSASIPICFDKEVRCKNIKRGHTLVMTGFGGGLTYGAFLCIF